MTEVERGENRRRMALEEFGGDQQTESGYCLGCLEQTDDARHKLCPPCRIKVHEEAYDRSIADANRSSKRTLWLWLIAVPLLVAVCVKNCGML